MPVGYSIYQERSSVVHTRLDPRTKLACMVTVFVLALAFNHPLVLAALMAVVLAVGVWSQLPIRSFAPFLASAAWFIVLGILIWPFYIQQGVVLLRLGSVQFTSSGVLFGLAMGLRVGLMVTAAGVWMMTTSPQKMTLGLMRMGMPYKAGMAMSTAIRFVPLINAERLTIVEAQRARGMDLTHGNPLSRAVRSVAVIGPMLVRALDIAQALAIAMDARAFGVRNRRTSIVEIELLTLDRLVLAGCVLAVVIALVLRLLGIGVIVRNYL
jgi:energy-coupling factor transport system permease protein